MDLIDKLPTQFMDYFLIVLNNMVEGLYHGYEHTSLPQRYLSTLSMLAYKLLGYNVITL